MALIPRPTGFLENPLNQGLLGNNKEIATGGITDASETNTNQINLLPGSLANGIAVDDTIEIESPAKLKFQTDAVIRVGVGNNLILNGLPTATATPTHGLFFDSATERVTFDTIAASSSSDWSTIPALLPNAMDMNFFNIQNVSSFNFTGFSSTDFNYGNYIANLIGPSATAEIICGGQNIVETVSSITVNASTQDHINFNGSVALANGLAGSGNFVAYKSAGTEWLAPSGISVNEVVQAQNILGPANSVFAQSAPSTTMAVTAVVGETYLAMDSQNRLQWLTQNTQALQPDDMFPENTQYNLNISSTAGGTQVFRNTVLGHDGLIYGIPFSSPFNSCSIDPQSDTINNTAFNISAANTIPRYALVVNNNIYMIPYVNENVSNPMFFPIYNTITKTLDTSVLVPWSGVSRGPFAGIADATERYIYMPPFDISNITEGATTRKYDILTQTWSEIGSTFSASNNSNSASAVGSLWASGCLAPNGKIYCFPWNGCMTGTAELAILKIDPDTDTTTLIGMGVNQSGTLNYIACCLSPDGNFIYGAPGSQPAVAKFDWRTETTTYPAGLAGMGGAAQKFGGICSAPNGFIYITPLNFGSWRAINPQTDTFDAFISVPNASQGNKYADPALAPNGKIYCLPWLANSGGQRIASVVKTGIPQIPNWFLSGLPAP